jgi:hypothetical protein
MELFNKADKMFQMNTTSFNFGGSKYQIYIAPAQCPQQLSQSQPHTPCSRNLVLSRQQGTFSIFSVKTKLS